MSPRVAPAPETTPPDEMTAAAPFEAADPGAGGQGDAAARSDACSGPAACRYNFDRTVRDQRTAVDPTGRDVQHADDVQRGGIIADIPAPDEAVIIDFAA